MITNTEPRYYKPSLSRTLLKRVVELFNEYPVIAESYDSNPVKFIERSILNLIDREEKKRIEIAKCRMILDFDFDFDF